MARRHTLIRTAIAGTALLWTATIASALTHVTSQRVHHILLAGSALAIFALLHIAGYVVVRRVMSAQVDRIETALVRVAASTSSEQARAMNAQTERLEHVLEDAVAQAADELHTAVATQGEVLRLDRAMITSARALMAELRSGRTRKVDKDRAV